jgi:hypothetical protein
MTAPGLAIHFRAFRLPRRGHAPEECQDAAAGAPELGRFAVADGAAESSYAGLWARMLVEDFVRRPERQPAWASWLPPLQQRWAQLVGWAAAGPALPWYLEAVLSRGAFATFLGLVVEGTTWHALAVGDSCLFQVRAGALVGAFPLTHSAEFGNAPWLVGSRTSPAEVPRKGALSRAGGWRGGDRLWLMTDALAQWFLRESEEGRPPAPALDGLLPADDGTFADWIEGLRDAGRLRNDDVTLVGVCL